MFEADCLLLVHNFLVGTCIHASSFLSMTKIDTLCIGPGTHVIIRSAQGAMVSPFPRLNIAAESYIGRRETNEDRYPILNVSDAKKTHGHSNSFHGSLRWPQRCYSGTTTHVVTT